MREDTLKTIEKEKSILICRGIYGEELIKTIEACYDGGIRIVEITFNAEGNPTDENIAENIAMLVTHFKGRMIVGAGTVLTTKQIELAKKAGAEFIISPDTNPEIIKKTREEELVSIPGALTPSEATMAHRLGADYVKLFPAGNMGLAYFKSVLLPLPHIRFLAVGGITNDIITEYYKAGAKGFGVASNILDKEKIKAGNFAAIRDNAQRYINIIHQAERG